MSRNDKSRSLKGGSKTGSIVKRKLKTVTSGKVFVNASFNNTIVTLTDQFGNVICASSSGARGFSGPRKSTPHAAQVTAEFVLRKAQSEYGLQNLEGVYVKGPGPGKDAAVRGLASVGLPISDIYDVTPVPHNGPTPRKRRRV
ncbi:30S ribosomal protein S11 [Candidatus Gromoviella agglomerans]|uniref:30S ribosomal protein S11 n=1 Tax=Candidatus Gromoviella agglomerans TaxID=2806609 RepID=UPI001E528383|nr:30S ribosomal protein S11 [Candidatus Gromoviella agglomerans]UFX98323.1 30S ribosomal protein S11 [Candidatus Gromoviella agglomerans]